MISAIRANQNSLVLECEWDRDCMIACCGAEVLFRLEGGYVNSNPAIYNDTAPHAPIPYKGWTPSKYFDQVRYNMSETDIGIPLEQAFGAVLQDLLCSSHMLYFASDNTTNRGDVHVGPFSTKGFMDWAEKLGVIDVGSTTVRHLKGYTFTVNGKAARKVVTRLKNEFRNFFNAELKKYAIQSDATSADRARRRQHWGEPIYTERDW